MFGHLEAMVREDILDGERICVAMAEEPAAFIAARSICSSLVIHRSAKAFCSKEQPTISISAVGAARKSPSLYCLSEGRFDPLICVWCD